LAIYKDYTEMQGKQYIKNWIFLQKPSETPFWYYSTVFGPVKYRRIR